MGLVMGEDLLIGGGMASLCSAVEILAMKSLGLLNVSDIVVGRVPDVCLFLDTGFFGQSHGGEAFVGGDRILGGECRKRLDDS